MQPLIQYQPDPRARHANACATTTTTSNGVPTRALWPGSVVRGWLLALGLTMSGCAATVPVVYHKPQATAAQVARAERDVQDCRRLAESTVGRNARSARKLAQESGKGAVIGFVGTAVGAAVANSKDVLNRARAGAAGGASGVATKILLDWNEPDKVHQEYVDRCMEDRGHVVLGWR